jgi:DNA-binding NarL/FixJ family response regulator
MLVRLRAQRGSRTFERMEAGAVLELVSSTPMERGITVAVVEDQARTRECLAAIIDGTPGCRAVVRAGSFEQALREIEREPPDVALCDIGLPGISGVEGVRRLKARHPEVQVVMLTVFADDRHVFEAICAGASGYLLKDTPPARLIDAIREVHAGGAPMSPEIARKVLTVFRRVAPPADAPAQLTPRELEVLSLLAAGQSYKTAAGTLDVSIDTLRSHVRNIYEKLHVHSKSEAVSKALRSGLIR